MKAEFINPFLKATHNVFRTMLSCEITRGKLGLKGPNSQQYDVNGLIGMSGNYQGMVVVSFDRETALRVAEILLCEPAHDLNAEVLDAVAEITNMIAGAAKTELAEHRLSIGLPTVIAGHGNIICFPSKSTPMEFPFATPLGSICIDVGLVPSAELVSAATEVAI